MSRHAILVFQLRRLLQHRLWRLRCSAEDLMLQKLAEHQPCSRAGGVSDLNRWRYENCVSFKSPLTAADHTSPASCVARLRSAIRTGGSRGAPQTLRMAGTCCHDQKGNGPLSIGHEARTCEMKLVCSRLRNWSHNRDLKMQMTVTALGVSLWAAAPSRFCPVC